MKILPFTISIGKSLDRMLDERLNGEDLARQMERMQRRGNQDNAIVKNFRTLPLREILYKDEKRDSWSKPYDDVRIVVRAYECGLKIPNCLVTSEDEIHFKDDIPQRQVVISEDLLLVRDVWNWDYTTKRPGSKIISAYMRPFSELEDIPLSNGMVEAFTREVFDRPVTFKFANEIGRIGGSREDKDFGKPVYEIRLLAPAESKRKYSNEYWQVRRVLEKVGYQKHEGRVCLA